MQATKRHATWQDLDLTDRPQEIWAHVPGYDGIYEASSEGRVKSLARWSYNRLLKPRIMSQVATKTPGLTLCIDGQQQRRHLMHIIAEAFCFDKPADNVYYHVDKNPFNNRLSNIAHGTHSTSVSVAYAVGAMQAVRPDGRTQGDYMRERQQRHENERGIFDGGQLVAKFCTACNMERPMTEYQRTDSATSNRTVCRECTLKRQGVREIGKGRRAAELLKAGLRTCSVCRQDKKLDTDFCSARNAPAGRAHRCKVCAKAYAQQSGAVAKAKIRRQAKADSA